VHDLHKTVNKKVHKMHRGISGDHAGCARNAKKSDGISALVGTLLAKAASDDHEIRKVGVVHFPDYFLQLVKS